MGPFLGTSASNAAGTLQRGLEGCFDDPARPHFRAEGIEITLDIDRYDIVVRVNSEDG
jgi:hypothetical protein